MFAHDDVDPEIRAWLTTMFAASAALGAEVQAESLAESGAGAGTDLTVAQRRAIAERQRAPWTRGGPVMHACEDLRVGPSQVRIRIHRPCAGPDLPVMVYLHGGGWVLFSIDTHDRIMREYAGRSGCAVLGIDYSPSPEHRFPRALDDIAEVLGWLAAQGRGHGLDTGRMALGGDSAGANLALAATLRGDAEPCALLLNYGAFDGGVRPSFARYGDPERYMLTGPEMDAFWHAYLGPEPVSDPLARPLQADLRGLPPTWLCVAECDVLHDENLEMARRLESAGVPCELRLYPGATHSFLEAVSVSKLAVRAIAEASSWLAQRLS